MWLCVSCYTAGRCFFQSISTETAAEIHVRTCCTWKPQQCVDAGFEANTGKQKTPPKLTWMLQVTRLQNARMHPYLFFKVFNDKCNPNAHLSVCLSVSTRGNWKALHYNGVPLGVFTFRSHNILKSLSAGRKPFGCSGLLIFLQRASTGIWLREWRSSFGKERVRQHHKHLCCISTTNEVINILHNSIWNRRVLLMLGNMEECVNQSLKSCEMLTTICLGNHNIWIWFRDDVLCWAMIKTWVTIRVLPVQHPPVRHS